MFELRPYQREAVQATLRHFRENRNPALIALPTGAGKSIVIAELARIAKGRVLVLAHVRELVEQNHSKYEALGLDAGIYSAGLHRKESTQKTIFASIQSIARADESFFANFSLVVIDECHRVSMQDETQYRQVIAKLQKENPAICVLGLTATPYRLGFGWIYQMHTQKKVRRTSEDRFFKTCVYELPLKYMIENGYLTRPIQITSPVTCYDFSTLKLVEGHYSTTQIEAILKDQKKITPVILANIVDMARDREGVMIFTSSVSHAHEILKHLPSDRSAIVVGETADVERDAIIAAFKAKRLKYLVNVSVLTTGFDAPHVDVIALLRPTESVSLYQQIIGRGLRLSPGKTDCLVLDYTGQHYDLYTPEIDDDKPTRESVAVEVLCPMCGRLNEFWGVVDTDTGEVLEHYGRKCQGVFEDKFTRELRDCGFLFRFKRCEKCGSENDIAARRCSTCENVLIDDEKKLKEAMTAKDAHVMRVDSMEFVKTKDRKGNERLEIRYHDADANSLREFYYFDSIQGRRAFSVNFTRMHSRLPEKPIEVGSIEQAIALRRSFREPVFVIARKETKFWVVRDKIFLG